ncbi:MAG: gamma-aminobutyraldehyde dehydrogenase [Leptospiraceae bacterium]|nr:gamma-aminobutyraldehyde dehydrogenase [Leptospiraceae bacterium]
MKSFDLWIDGKWIKSKSNQKLKVENPATEETLFEISDASKEDVDMAVNAAHKAFYDGRWSRLTPGQRSNILWKFAELLENKTEELAKAESLDVGKPYANLSLAGDIPFAIDNLRFFASAAREVHGAKAGEYAAGYTSMLRREPVGVVAQIAPWNYPFLMAMWKIGPALAAGCTVILKPAPNTPYTSLLIAEISKEAGLPDGVLNIITGGNDTGQALVEHPLVRMVSLTGSTQTGKKIMKTAADSLKRVHLELGGKAPLLVFDDTDLSVFAKKAAFGSTCNTGQDCTAATRVYIHKSILNKATEALVEIMKATKLGDPFSDTTEMGPLVSKIQRDRVLGFIERAKSKGAKILTGGEIPSAFAKGYYFEPTVISNIHQSDEVIQSEIFGPVLTIQEFDSEEDVITMANDVPYGLASSIWTKDISRAMRVSSRLEFGTVWVNDHLPLASETPHGGFKQSGFGKDLSSEAISDYLITKHVMIAN